MEGTRECYDRSLGYAMYLTRELKDITEDMETIKIGYREISSKTEGVILDLLEVRPNLDARETKIRKVWSDLDDTVMSLGTIKYETNNLRGWAENRDTEVG